MSLIEVDIKKTEFHTIKLDSKDYPEELWLEIKAAAVGVDASYFADWVCDKTLDNDELDFD